MIYGHFRAGANMTASHSVTLLPFSLSKACLQASQGVTPGCVSVIVYTAVTLSLAGTTCNDERFPFRP
jgi:hypothetical protein